MLDKIDLPKGIILKTKGIVKTTNEAIPLAAVFNRESYGYVIGKIFNPKEPDTILGNIRFRKDSIPSITITEMNNRFPETYKHIGTALHETAFRAYAGQFRIELEAAWSSHYFHYLSGFRAYSSLDETLDYYFKLAKNLLQAADKPMHGEIEKFNLYLPLPFIQKKMDEWHLASPLDMSFKKMIKENKALRQLRYIGEYIMTRTEKILFQSKIEEISLNIDEELEKIRLGVENEEWKPVSDENAQAELFSKRTNKQIYKFLSENNFFNSLDQQKENYRMVHSQLRNDYRKEVSLLFAGLSRKLGSDLTQTIASRSNVANVSN